MIDQPAPQDDETSRPTPDGRATRDGGPAPDGGLYRVRRIATSDFDPADRFEAWRQTAYSVVELETPATGDAELTGIKRHVHGTMGSFETHEGSAHRTIFTAAASLAGAADSIVVSLLAEGEVGLDSPCGARITSAAGRLIAYDTTRPMRYSWSPGKEIFILLPRARALEALGGGFPGLVLPLDNQPLGIMVREQMAMLDRHAEELGPKEMAVALDGLHALVLILLQNVGRDLGDGTAPEDNSLFLAARRYIEANFRRIELSPEMIAKALGCSRATLYRAFAQNDAAIMDVLREVRLSMSRRMIEAGSERGIAAIAYGCGFADASAFGKQFRAKFGVSPSEWRDTFR